VVREAFFSSAAVRGAAAGDSDGADEVAPDAEVLALASSAPLSELSQATARARDRAEAATAAVRRMTVLLILGSLVQPDRVRRFIGHCRRAPHQQVDESFWFFRD
jgi:hypothetical protein